MNNKNTEEIPYLQMQKIYDLDYLDLVRREELQNIINKYTRIKEQLEYA
ncbi:MAG: hypothetical protein J6M60_04100 [Clostridia bacterium]|nr:hypothetical protein [Clostridia bacterium]